MGNPILLDYDKKIYTATNPGSDRSTQPYQLLMSSPFGGTLYNVSFCLVEFVSISGTVEKVHHKIHLKSSTWS